MQAHSLDHFDREELRKLTESVVVRHQVDGRVIARLAELGYARMVYGGWEITEAGWHALGTRLPRAFT